MKKLINIALLSMTFAFASVSASAQTAIATDVVSRYVWRGADFGNSASIQPTLSYTVGGFTVGTWASYALVSGAAAEHDFFAGYSMTTDAGTFGVTATDYYYPTAGIKFGKFEGDNVGAHTFELSASYSGLFKVLASVNVFNDTTNSAYLEVGYDYAAEGATYSYFVGTALNESPVWYGVSELAVINVGVKVAKTITLTEKFSLPVSSSLIYNPAKEVSYLVVGFTL